ncbi:TetR/AcrR family transcriptional regulator [Desulfolucanica intricata]|uniref:TetR/AcrR family transcriptional regulator n=1 Tax=Desulfolucanica intricata TaxID=1285191 RepID=UPI00082B1F89|nr:TetR/AcrR family transcriptional regulator [Desulfolucanica intricata]
MADRTTDRRIIRTKRLIRDALTELMEEKGFEGITVNELTAKADINRGTFYLHYRDKHDLLKQSEDEIIQEINEIIKAAQQLVPIGAKNYNQQPEHFPFIVKLFEYLLENSDFMKVILGPKGDPSFQVKLKEVLRNNLLESFVKIDQKEEMMVPIEYLIAYVCSAHLGVIQHWLESGMKKSPQDMALVLSRMTLLGPGYVAGLVNY